MMRIGTSRFGNVRSKLAILGLLLFVSTNCIATFNPVAVRAATMPATAKVSFTFDDGLTSAYTQAAPTLAKYGLSGTNYVITGCVGMTTTPNKCRANTAAPYMSWAQVTALQKTYGWEIGSHTVDHDCLADSAATDPSDCQKNLLTQAQVDTEMSQSKAALAANGINATDFAAPYGDYNNMVIAQVAKYYATMRGFKDQNNNVAPYDDYLLNDVTVQEKTDTVASIEAKIDQAIAGNNWLTLTFHDIAVKPSTNPDDYQYGTAELDQIAAYVKAKQGAGLIQSVHVNQGIVTSNTNLLPNGNFAAGIANGWTTDDPTGITADAGNNGSYPDPTHSIKLVSSTTGRNTHLFSPQVAVNSSTTYLFKNFLNVQTITGGQVAFYVDEYDVNNNWISGQYLKAENSSFVEDLNFAYRPSSAAVSRASLQVIVAGTGITAYLANSQMFPVQTTTPPAQSDLLPNSTFDAGLSAGWTTDDATNITADAAGNGSAADPTNSISLKSSTVNTHLFSPKVAVAATKSYSLSSYLNLKQLTAASGGEVAFYIDEYDASGNWISGQYKLGVHTLGAGTVNFQYTPSSTAVAAARLQVIVVGNAGIQAYFDDATWYAN